MLIILGKDCRLYRNTGTAGSPTWNECPNVEDLGLDVSHDEVEVSIRASGGVKWFEAGMRADAIEFSSLRDTDDADQTAFFTAAMARTSIDFAVAEGNIATAGTRFYRAVCKAFGQKHDEPLRDAKKIAWTWKPCPESTVVAGFYTTA